MGVPQRRRRFAFGFSLAWLLKRALTWPDSPFGVCTHFGQHKHKISATRLADRRAWAPSGFATRSVGAESSEVRRVHGRRVADRYMAAAGKLGLRPLIIFDYGNDLYDKGDSPHTPEAIAAFTEYCRRSWQRYKSRLPALEILERAEHLPLAAQAQRRGLHEPDEGGLPRDQASEPEGHDRRRLHRGTRLHIRRGRPRARRREGDGRDLGPSLPLSADARARKATSSTK